MLDEINKVIADEQAAILTSFSEIRFIRHCTDKWKITAILTSFSEIRPRAEDPQGKIRPAILTSFSEISG